MTCEGHDKPCVATSIVKATSGDEASLNADKAVTNQDAANRFSHCWAMAAVWVERSF